jgi:hypothetical protein
LNSGPIDRAATTIAGVSGASIAEDTGSRPSRYHILYPRQNLKEFRTMLVAMFFVAVGFGGYEVLVLHKVSDATIFLLYGFFPIAFASALYIFGALASVSFDDDGVSVRYGPFRRAHLDYADIEKGRLETVESIWERSGRKPSKMIRNLYKRKALCIKLRGDDELPHRLSRKLGPRLVFERDLVLPVTDIEDAMGALKDGLQRHRGASAPAAPSARRGHRRGKRGRR